ncbi:MAG: Hsp20/alpha crystallin family protein [Candidatus Hadarchaeota archaeon]|nr:Hsp20/alpha crystallin family protein [Candidatus Hadarchaeota archaeon]
MPVDPFDDFNEFFKRLRRMMFEDFKEFERGFMEKDLSDLVDLSELGGRPEVRGFRVEIRDRGTGKPEIKVRKFGEPAKEIELAPEAPPQEEKPPEVEVKPPEVKPVKRMLETNVAKVEKLDEVVLTMQAPEVKEEDVEIRQLGKTLEVVARKPRGEAYFAAFELPPDADPGDRTVEIKDDMLVITIPRHR